MLRFRSHAPMCLRTNPSNSAIWSSIVRQSLSLGFLLTLLCLNMYVNVFCSLDNPGKFRKDDFANQGKYKTWILNHLLPSLHFHLMVNDIPKSHVYSLQRLLTRMMKKGLHLPHCTTPSVIFHPNSLDLKFLPLFLEEAKMSLLTMVTHKSLSASPLCRTHLT